MLHSRLLIILVVILNCDLDHVLEHQSNQVDAAVANVAFSGLLFLLSVDFLLCKRNPEFDTLQADLYFVIISSLVSCLRYFGEVELEMLIL